MCFAKSSRASTFVKIVNTNQDKYKYGDQLSSITCNGKKFSRIGFSSPEDQGLKPGEKQLDLGPTRKVRCLVAKKYQYAFDDMQILLKGHVSFRYWCTSDKKPMSEKTYWNYFKLDEEGRLLRDGNQKPVLKNALKAPPTCDTASTQSMKYENGKAVLGSRNSQ